jgi:4-carboxymuconolactone decarboxylase
MTEDLATLGRATRLALWGEGQLAAVDDILARFDDGFARYLNEQLFGELWNRPGLAITSRSMITVATLLALGRTQELRLHMRGALNLGLTADDLKEIVIHVGQYAGVPIAVEGIRAFLEVTQTSASAA